MTQAQLILEGSPVPKSRARESAAELFTRTEQRLGAFLAQMVRDRELAADLLQDTFHDVVRAGGRMEAVENVDAWLFAIARNRALAALRRRRRLGRTIARLRQSEDSSPEAADVLALRELLERSLSPDERSLLLLRYVHGFDGNELAQIFRTSPEAMRKRLSRTRAKLLAAARAGGWDWSGGWTRPT